MLAARITANTRIALTMRVFLGTASDATRACSSKFIKVCGLGFSAWSLGFRDLGYGLPFSPHARPLNLYSSSLEQP